MRVGRGWQNLFPVFLLCQLLHSVPLQAQEQLPDVRLLIDVSGSMRESDPQNLRKPALELMVRLLPEGSKAGVWTFGQWINMVVPHGVVDDAWRREAAGAVAEISNFGLRTNIPRVVERSTFDIESLQHPYRTSLILLTDGKVDVSEDGLENRRAARELLQNIAPELRDWGVTVHTIALSEEADWEFLRAFAQVTGGLAERAQSPEELTAVFLQALDIAAPTEQVPLFGGEFLIDESVEEFTVLVFTDESAGEVSLLTPTGETITRAAVPAGTNWHHNDRFELITVSEPDTGEWRIVAPGAISRVNVISHLTLGLDRLPTTMPSGHSPEIGLRLLDSEEVITDPDLLDLVDVEIRVKRADGEQWELAFKGRDAGSSGELRIELPMLSEAGRYEIVVHVDGRSFQREISLVSDVVAPRSAHDPADAVPAELPRQGMPGWLLPAGVSTLLLLGLLVWWWRRRQQEEGWYEEEEEGEYDYADEDGEER
jgi:hypothetical protein